MPESSLLKSKKNQPPSQRSVYNLLFERQCEKAKMTEKQSTQLIIRMPFTGHMSKETLNPVCVLYAAHWKPISIQKATVYVCYSNWKGIHERQTHRIEC